MARIRHDLTDGSARTAVLLFDSVAQLQCTKLVFKFHFSQLVKCARCQLGRN